MKTNKELLKEYVKKFNSPYSNCHGEEFETAIKNTVGFQAYCMDYHKTIILQKLSYKLDSLLKFIDNLINTKIKFK